ncbi:hypothetical protein [Streptomyces sp. ICC4]|uniref:hypothetical protein n=1 Tax=Streptomyces sp. ICC4 TaxID=2099584 RepID=UPI0013A6AF59|nr:hypothetical protein [Streptomyces sp. ICC4]
MTAGAKPPTAQDAVRLASDLVAAGFATLAAAAEGCDVLLANGMTAAAADAATVTAKLLLSSAHPEWPTTTV